MVDSAWATALGIVLATFVSEDLTLVGIGEALRAGHLRAWPAITAAAFGIFVGDVGLLMAGRVGFHGLARWTDVGTPTTLSRWVDAHPGLAILGSRFLPGARVPMYLAAGAWGKRPWTVVAWMGVAALVWTPLVVTLVRWSGQIAVSRLTHVGGPAWLAPLLVVALVLGLGRTTRNVRRDPARWLARLERARRWEFWPAWLVNLPVVVWVACLAWRHRSLTLFTLANPAIDDGGFVGESKAAILDAIAGPSVLPSVLLPPGPPAARIARMRTLLAEREWKWPIVGKPDVGQRGMGVRWLATEAEAIAYLSTMPVAVLLQMPHLGPYEAGLYYERPPGATRGRLTSITDKHFPQVVGDGRTPLRCLVRRHPRYRLQEGLFARRWAAQWHEVPADGEVVVLGRVGNHAQGTEFRDGAHLWTAALEAQVDAIARRCPGLHLGRFDVRYGDLAAFREGRDLAVVEFNGVAAEPTHIYAPGTPLRDAWRALGRHWTLAYRFGDACRVLGHAPMPLPVLLRRVGRYLVSPRPRITSD